MSSFPLKVLFGRNARRDLLLQADYISTDSGLTQAERFVKAVAHTAELISQTSQIGKLIRPAEGGRHALRGIPISKPFQRWIIFYVVTTTSVRIERIFHGARNIGDYYP